MDGFGVSPLEIMASDAYLRGLCWCDEFMYSAIFSGTTALAASVNMSVQILINGDSDFIVQERDLVAFSADHAIAPDPNIEVTLVRGGSGREVMNQPQHVLNTFGSFASNKQPGRMPFSAFLGRAQILTVKLNNLSTVAFERIDVTFKGFKVFYLQSTDKNGNIVTGNSQNIFHVA